MAEEKAHGQDDPILPVPIHLLDAENPAPGPFSSIVSEPLYTVFTSREKVMLVAIGSAAALLSPLTANIYYPALNDLSHDLDVSYNLINLTITVYLIFLGLSPTFIGSFSDVAGRRPAYLICFVLFLAANIGLALQDSYVALMLLRCLQSSGSSGTVVLGNAMVSDIVTTSERGSYIGYASIGALLGPAIGPIIGGVLNQFLGWRAIFWFLVILSSVILVTFLIFLPETCRKVVGDGSHPAQQWNISLLAYLKAWSLKRSNQSPTPIPQLARKRLNLLGSISIIFSKEGGLILLYIGLLFAGFSTTVAALPSDFTRIYNFNSLQIGLCYIPFGCGSMTAAVLTGKAVDWNFRRHARRLNYLITKGRQSDISKFPIERSRLEVTCPLVLLGSVSIIAYGWVLHSTSHLAGPLILLYFLAFSISGAFSSLSTLMVDLYPEAPGTATAANNLVRCWIGAGAVAGVGSLLNLVGTGWFGVLVAGVWVSFSPLLWVVYRWGPEWREERRVRRSNKDNEEQARRVGDVPPGQRL